MVCTAALLEALKVLNLVVIFRTLEQFPSHYFSFLAYVRNSASRIRDQHVLTVLK